MSEFFSIDSSTGAYDVRVERGLLARALSAREDTQVIADAFFHPQLTGLSREPIFVEATEFEKSLDRMTGLIETMRAKGLTRGTALVAIGGGIIQDIAAFAASVYMRGLAWSYVPTTVLAMVDSCIGGKSSINVGPYKNLVGTIHPPEHIYVDPAFAETLPHDQFASGLIEAVKICYCRSGEALTAHLSLAPSVSMSTDVLEKVIVNSLRAKKYFIEIDEFDKKERLLLNFGHTFGHAIEGASHYRVPHGIAVGLGICCALNFQRDRGIDFSGTKDVALFAQHLSVMIRTLPGLGEILLSLEHEDVMKRLESDKKHTASQYTLILPVAEGGVRLERVDKTPSIRQAIRKAMEATLVSFQQ